MYGFLIGVNYFAIFHAQGVFSQIFAQEIADSKPKWLEKLKPLSIGGFYMLYAFTCPTNYSNTGFLFYYPIYFSYLYQVSYVVGSWLWVYVLMWVGKKVITQKGDLYDAVVGAGMWAYISHYLFIVLSSEFLVRPLKLSYEIAVLCNFIVTEVAISVSHRFVKNWIPI